MSDVNLSVEIDIPVNTLIQSIQGRINRCQKVLDSQVLKDSNYYCPQDTGTLQKSGILNTVIGSGRVVWNTPYACRLYEHWKGGRFSRNRNPNATSKWFETAKANRLYVWEKLVNDEYRKGN